MGRRRAAGTFRPEQVEAFGGAAACAAEAYVFDKEPKRLNVRESQGMAGKVNAVIPADKGGTIPSEAEVKVFGCAGDGVQVKYKNLTAGLTQMRSATNRSQPATNSGACPFVPERRLPSPQPAQTQADGHAPVRAVARLYHGDHGASYVRLLRSVWSPTHPRLPPRSPSSRLGQAFHRGLGFDED